MPAFRPTDPQVQVNDPASHDFMYGINWYHKDDSRFNATRPQCQGVPLYGYVDDWDRLERGHDIQPKPKQEEEQKEKHKQHKEKHKEQEKHKEKRKREVEEREKEDQAEEEQEEVPPDYMQVGQQVLWEKFEEHSKSLHGFSGEWSKDGTAIYYKVGGFLPCAFSKDDADCDPYFIYNTDKGRIMQKCRSSGCPGSQKGQCKVVVDLLKQAQAEHRKKGRDLHLQEQKQEKERKEKKQKEENRQKRDLAALENSETSALKQQAFGINHALPNRSAERSEASALEPQQAYVINHVLANLSAKRLSDFDSWINFIKAMSTVFNKNDIGLAEVTALAPDAVKAAMCKPVYLDLSAGLGFDDLIGWSKDDSPEQFKEEDVVVANNINEQQIYSWIEGFNDGTFEIEVEELREKIVSYMNQWICIIRRSTGKPNIIEEVRRPERKNRVTEETQLVTHFIIRSPQDAVTAYNKFRQMLHGEKQPQNPMERWLAHHKSREFDYIDFDPSGNTPQKSMFNLFRGLAISREKSIEDKEQAKIVTDHVLNIWCKGAEELCAFLLDWMAHLVQRPGEKMIAAPVLKGGQGAGKGIIIQMLGDILGHEHFIAATRLESITGTFQEDKIKTNLLTFLDECTFAGDKKQSSVLKGLLSEQYRRWEAKFVNPIRVKNYSNFIVASNYDEIVLVEHDDRRWFCLEVDSKYAGPQTPESAAYFNRLSSVDVRHFAHFLYTQHQQIQSEIHPLQQLPPPPKAPQLRHCHDVG